MRDVNKTFSAQNSYNKEEGKARLVEYEEKKKRKTAKADSFDETSSMLKKFMGEVVTRKKKGWCMKSWSDAQKLAEAVSDYLDTIFEIGLFPTKTGLALFLDIDTDTLKIIAHSIDDRAAIIKIFDNFIQEFAIQQGLKTEGNPAFNIFDCKSRLGMSENSNININVSQPNLGGYMSQEEIANIIDMTPSG